MKENAVLEVRDVCKYFPGVKALQGVDFTLCKFYVYFLIG